MNEIKQPMPKKDFAVSYVCRYESEIDRQIILDSMGHYIEDVLGTQDILFVKVPMEAINKTFKLDPNLPGEEIEFTVSPKTNNVIKYTELVNDELPALWAVLRHEESEIQLITTIEPCKFIIKRDDLEKFEALMLTVEIAPKDYNYDALNMVHWNEITKDLKRDIEFFVAGKKFFDSRGLPYNRSYLLHGPPGNGKTTTIKALSKFLNARPESFDFSAAMNSPDKQFQAWVLGDSERIAREEEDEPTPDWDDDDTEAGPTPIRLLVVEDIDRLFPKDGTKHTAVTLQAVLQALDGAVERRNTVIIATANHPKSLDQKVLARPGRFDKQILYEAPNLDHALQYLKKLFKGEEVTDETLIMACEGLQTFSYAFHKELFATSASYAIERSSKVIGDEDVAKGLADLKKHITTVVMKSENAGIGFTPGIKE